MSLAASARRIGAVMRRHIYVLRSSWPRLLEMAYWPTMQMIIWGFVSQFFYTQSSWVAQAFGVLLGGVMLWDVLFRGQLGFSLSFLEEMWAHNLANLYVSPLRPWEHIVAMMAMSILRTFIGVLPAALLAILLYRFSIFDLGLPLLAYYLNLMMMAWAVGMVSTALLMRFGLGAENLVWFIVFLLAPISAIYYPVTVLPGWLQQVAWALPSTHVFEGMRETLF
ncbi:MAG: ABC transporter permease, partial [Dongiaceae bacterium]